MADDFLTTYAPLANDISGQTGLHPATVLGIIDTETGHGQHVLGNNIFGISPGGRVAQYPDVQTASQAFVGLMRQPNYARAATVTDPAAQAQLLVRGGYNTVNPKYAQTVAASAQNAVKQLGYQDGSASTQSGDTSQPAPDYNNPPPPNTQPPASTTPPAQPQQGSAKDRVLSDPALSPSGGAGAAPASAKDRVLADPALQVTTTPPKEAGTAEALPAVDDYGRPIPTAPLSPPSLPTKQDVEKFLAPAPNTTYGDILPLAKDNTTGAIRLALPNIIRNPLIGLTEQGPGTDGTFGSSGVTWNPQTGTYGLTPEAASVGQFAATPLRFSGANPLHFVPPGSLQRDPLPAGATALNPDAAARIRAAQGGPVPVEPPTVPTPFNTPPTAAVPGVSAEAAAAAAQAKPTSLPTGVPVTPPEAPPATGGGGVGAQVTPSYEAIHTPAEEAAYRANAEGQKLIEGQKIGEPDQNMYIPGETANAAEQEQTVESARELKALGAKVPEASQADKLAAENNDTLRKNYVANTAKGPVDIYNRGVQREADINADKATVFAPENVKGPVDLAPVVGDMEKVLNDPFNRQDSSLEKVYRPLMERIANANIENPMEAWSLRRDIDKMKSARFQADDPHLHSVGHELNGVADAIDQQIEKVAPGYADMLTRYKEHSRAIDEMTVLQKATDKLRGPGQKLTFNDFQRFMKNVVDSRMSPSFDLNPYKAISPENMQRLWNVRDSLRRSASAMDLARAAGSDTMPNIYDAMKQYAKLGGTGALHLAAGSIFGPGGNVAAQTVLGLGKTLLDRRAMQRDMGRMQQLLHPPTPLRAPPGQENPLTGAPPP